ncbi:MAG: class I SAM-dependent methyltransferase, partial [Thermoanaerobaculia bacterium]
RYFDRFVPGQALSETEREGLANEVPGAVSRVRDYYLPLLRRERGPVGRALRVLDSGCGNGMSVDLLCEAGFEAWGVDLSALRKWQWRGRRRRDRLACAEGGRLPFADGFFDALLCSGVLEHVGVEESRGETYRVRVMPGRDAARIAFLAEQARVLSPGGVLWLDFPNGAFPIDFWHGARAGAPRWHSPREGFLPTAAEVRRYAAALHAVFRVRALGAEGRLQFRQVGRHWYGRLLRLPAALWLRLLGAPLFSALLETPLNPFLVLELRKAR